MTKQTTALNVEPVIAEAWDKAAQAQNPVEFHGWMRALARRLDEQRDGMNDQQRECLDLLIAEVDRFKREIEVWDDRNAGPCIVGLLLAATAIGGAATGMSTAVYVPLLETMKSIAVGRRRAKVARGERDDAIRAVKRDHPDWSMGQVKRHSPLVERFPDVAKLTDERIRQITSTG